MSNIEAVDLFCGVGGLTFGLSQANIDVLAGVDIDPASHYPFEANNDATFIQKSVEDIHGRKLRAMYSSGAIRLLAGCAPCQPFSSYSQGARGKNDNQWNLLSDFGRIVDESKPDLVTMENVPALIHHPVFEQFVKNLREYPSGRKRYHVSYQLVECEKYGLPQTRKRLVLLASKFGPISLKKPSVTRKTVKQSIGKQKELRAGEVDSKDTLHRSASLLPKNLERIRQSIPGGTWRDWDKRLVANCHIKKSGTTYSSVYGRMEWDKPSPTITTQFYGFGNGRFGHPEQDRAISLREGAILQSFPKSYKFVEENQPVYVTSVGRLIGNAVPPLLGKLIGDSIQKHVKQYK
jgi:DNA (cytosine-5)-methyltransferase 1